jgi:hypothetical protein
MSAAPATLHLNGDTAQAAPIRRGDTFSHVITFVDDAAEAINKASSTFVAQIRNLPGDGAVIQAFTTAVSGAGSNLVTVSLTATQTAALTPGTYGWDLQETAGTEVTTRVAGDVLITQDFSR